MQATTAPTERECPTVRVPELSEYLAKIDVAYAAMPVNRKPAAAFDCELHMTDVVAGEIRGAMLIMLLIIASIIGLALALGVLFLGFGWLTALGTYFATGAVSLILWVIHI